MKIIRLPLFIFSAGLMLLLTACPGEIKPTVSSVTVSPKQNSMKVGEVMNLTATVEGTNLTDKNVTWSSSNSSLATVSRGTVMGVAEGQVTITATSNADKSKSDSVTLTITEKPPILTPTLTISPTNQTVTIGGSAVTFAAVKQNMAEAVTWSLSAPEGTLSATIGDQTTYTPPTTSTATSVTLTASAGSLTATAQITLSKIEPEASIDSVEIVDNGTSTQIRQGFGTVTVIARGKGLEQAANARLSPANILGTIDQSKSNNTSVTISFDIKHGVEGLQGLSFDVKDVGNVAKANALTITKITFSPTGSDTTGKGTADNPFKTLDNFNYSAASGDTLYLTTGIHLRTQTFFVPDGVTLEGESPETKLQASGGMGGDNGLQFFGTATVQNLTLDSFETCAYVSFDQNVTLNNVTIQNCRNNGLLLQGNAIVTANTSTFTQNDNDSIDVDNDAQFTMVGGESSANGWTGLYMHGNNAKVFLEDVTITGNGNDPASTLDSGIEIGANGVDSSIKVRNSTIENNQGHGVLIYGNVPVIDFGTVADSGGNNIRNNRKTPGDYWEVSDGRGSTTPVIELVGTVLQNNTALSGLMTCDGTPSKCQFANAGINYWRILAFGNSIRLTNP